jgi:hypothetical protein
LTIRPATSKEASVSGWVRTPSGPKNIRPSPDKAKCSATATVSSSRTEASAIGRKTMRSSKGAIGSTRAIDRTMRSGIESVVPPASQTAAAGINGSRR